MSFRLRNVFFDSRNLGLFVKNGKDNGKNSFTIIIGPNGIGKSRLLASIAHTFRGFDLARDRRPSLRDFDDRGRKDFSLQYEIDNEVVDLAWNKKHGILKRNYAEGRRPRRVICASSSPFDKFPITRSNPVMQSFGREDLRDPIYRYLGSKNNLGQFSSKAQIKRFIEFQVFADRKSQAELDRLSNVFEFLGYEPRMRVVYRLEQEFGFFQDLANAKSIDQVFDSLFQAGSAFRRTTRTSIVDDFFNKNPLASTADIQRAAQIIGNTAEQRSKRLLSLNLDFVERFVNRESLEKFYATSLLSKFGLLYLHDVELFKTTPVKRIISIKDASSGEQCIVVTVLGIASEISDNCLICIDEPEISLHPEWQERYIELLTETFCSFSGCHFILATHSPQILARVKGENSHVLLMDEGKLYPASDYSERSADFQLVEAFKAPGYKNEYLAREALTVFSHLNRKGTIEEKYQKQYETLVETYKLLDSSDPVAKLIDAIMKAKEELTQ